ncbi:hypothetical protein TeGR_g4739, partial [Tetraparma gracilis]
MPPPHPLSPLPPFPAALPPSYRPPPPPVCLSAAVASLQAQPSLPGQLRALANLDPALPHLDGLLVHLAFNPASPPALRRAAAKKLRAAPEAASPSRLAAGYRAGVLGLLPSSPPALVLLLPPLHEHEPLPPGAVPFLLASLAEHPLT